VYILKRSVNTRILE